MRMVRIRNLSHGRNHLLSFTHATSKWFYAIYMFTTTRHGVSAKELQRQLGVAYPTAWRMGHEIRKYMARVDGEHPLNGVVEADETYVGGKRSGGRRGRGAPNKTVVFGMLERGGEVMTKVVPNVQKQTLEPIVSQNVEAGIIIRKLLEKFSNRFDIHCPLHCFLIEGVYQNILHVPSL